MNLSFWLKSRVEEEEEALNACRYSLSRPFKIKADFFIFFCCYVCSSSSLDEIFEVFAGELAADLHSSLLLLLHLHHHHLLLLLLLPALTTLKLKLSLCTFAAPSTCTNQTQQQRRWHLTADCNTSFMRRFSSSECF